MSLYKIINLLLVGTSITIWTYVYWIYESNYCVDRCGFELMRAVVQPIYAGVHILAVVFAVLLLFPADLFRRWLWYLGGPYIVISILHISALSISRGSIAAPTRVGMAELLAQGLAVVTVVFIIGYYAYTWYQSSTIIKK